MIFCSRSGKQMLSSEEAKGWYLSQTPVTVTLCATTAAVVVGSLVTSLSIEPLPIPLKSLGIQESIEAGTYLVLNNGVDTQYVQLAADAYRGATTLSLRPVRMEFTFPIGSLLQL